MARFCGGPPELDLVKVLFFTLGIVYIVLENDFWRDPVTPRWGLIMVVDGSQASLIPPGHATAWANVCQPSGFNRHTKPEGLTDLSLG
ncbi:MAG: hypothetical protein WCF65_09005 [Parachlamydiaceae bacterium]